MSNRPPLSPQNDTTLSDGSSGVGAIYVCLRGGGGSSGVLRWRRENCYSFFMFLNDFLAPKSFRGEGGGQGAPS